MSRGRCLSRCRHNGDGNGSKRWVGGWHNQSSLQDRSLNTNWWAWLDAVFGHVPGELIGYLGQKCRSQGSFMARAVVTGSNELNDVARLFEHLGTTGTFVTIQKSHL